MTEPRGHKHEYKAPGKWAGVVLRQGKYHLVVNGFVVATEGDPVRDPRLEDFWTKEDMERIVTGGCACDCSHATDYGPCTTFEKGRNGRCVYCDHAGLCHAAMPWEGRIHNRPIGGSWR